MSVKVQLLGKLANARFLSNADNREWKGLEATGLVVPRTILKRAASGKRPDHVYRRGKASQDDWTVYRDHNEHMLRPNSLIEKRKNPMFRGLDRYDKFFELVDTVSHLFVAAAEQPPVGTNFLVAILLSFRIYAIS